jgi:hypothetical protein
LNPSAILARVKALRTAVLALSVTAVLTAPAPATAQDDEVYINPDSPSGVEYDLPLERARRDADPKRDEGAEVARQSQSAAPFGAGVGPADDGATTTASARANGSKAAKQRRGRGGRDAALPPEVAAAAAQPVAPARSSGSTLLYAGLGTLVVAAGGLVGLLLRRRHEDG